MSDETVHAKDFDDDPDAGKTMLVGVVGSIIVVASLSGAGDAAVGGPKSVGCGRRGVRPVDYRRGAISTAPVKYSISAWMPLLSSKCLNIPV